MAQSAISTLDTVVVTASGLDQHIADTIPHTSVITEREIRNSGQSDLPGLLRGLAGFDFTQSGGHGTLSTVFMRGSEGRQMLLLLDGVPVGSATSGTVAIDQLPLDEIERIEIVRGNVSALYGSGAVGGVIQVFTRQGRDAPAPHAALELGSRDSRRASAGYRGALGDTRFSLNLSHFRTDGQSAIDPALAKNVNPDRDGYRNTGVTASMAHKLSAAHELSLRLYHQQGRADFDDSGDYADPTDVHRLDTGLDNAAFTWSARFGEAWQSRVVLGSSYEKSDGRRNGAPAGRFRTHGGQIEWRNDLTIAADQVLSATVGAHRQAIDSDTGYEETSRRSKHLAAAYNAELGAAQLQAALRHDRYSGDIGHATTGLLGVGWRIDERFKLIGTLSTAFNAPTFNQLYYPFGFGNKDLQPEHARSVELGAQYASGRTLARLNWFRTRFTDLIDYDANSRPVNVAKARTQGIELTASTEIEGWRLQASLTSQQPEDGDGRTLNRRARQFGSVEAGRDFGAWRIKAQLTSAGSRPDLDFGPYPAPAVPVTLGSYTLLNLNGAWRLAPSLWLTARINNATDRQYSTAYSYPSLGREVHVGIAWQP